MKLDKIAKAVIQRQQNNQRAPRAKPVKEKRIEPTPEQRKRNAFRSVGMAHEKIPVIEQLLNAGKITSKHYDALLHYRNQAHQAQDDTAEHSPSSPDKMMTTGSGGAVTGTIPKNLLDTPAKIETARIERELGNLLYVTRAIAVDDVTLSQWAIQTSGGREKLQGGGVVIVPKSRKAVQFALLDIKFASGRILY